MTSWDDARIGGCESIETLRARKLALEEHSADLGEACAAVEYEMKACRGRIKQLRAEGKRPGQPGKPRPRPTR
jgi:hypothetical protein